MKQLYYIGVLLLLLTSCMSTEKAARVLDRDRLAAAEYCAARFEVSETTGPPEIEHRPGNTKELQEVARVAQEKADSLQKIVDSTPVTPGNEAAISARDKVIQEQRKQITGLQSKIANLKPDTVRQTIPIYRVNTAQVEALQIKLGKEKSTREKAEAESKTKTNWIIGLFLGLGAIGAALFFSLRRK